MIGLSIEVTVHISRNLYDNNQKYDQIYRAVEKVIVIYNKKKPDHIPFFSLSAFYTDNILNIGVSGDLNQVEKSQNDFLDLIKKLELNGSVKGGDSGRNSLWS